MIQKRIQLKIAQSCQLSRKWLINLLSQWDYSRQVSLLWRLTIQLHSKICNRFIRYSRWLGNQPPEGRDITAKTGINTSRNHSSKSWCPSTVIYYKKINKVLTLFRLARCHNLMDSSYILRQFNPSQQPQSCYSNQKRIKIIWSTWIQMLRLIPSITWAYHHIFRCKPLVKLARKSLLPCNSKLHNRCNRICS